MAFVCILDPDNHLHVEGFRRKDKYSIFAHIGYDDFFNRNYFSFVGLEAMGGGDLEYYFHILEVDVDAGEERAYWSGRDVARFINEADRSLVLATVLAGTKMLLDTVKPVRVARITHDADMPPHALEKHFAISRIFEECGYRVTTADPFHGKRCWIAERIAAEPVESV